MDIWKFKPQNELKVQQLLGEMAKNHRPDNKWHIFMSEAKDSMLKKNVSFAGSSNCSERSSDERIVGSIIQNESQEQIRDEELRSLRELIENDFATNVDSIAKLCTEKHTFWEYLADNLSEQDIEVFIKHFSDENTSSRDTVGGFINIFARLLAVGKYSRAMLEAVLAVHRNNPADFENHLLPVMYSHKDTPADVLTDFCKSISDADKTKILKTISNLKHDTEMMSKHLSSILILYQASDKLNGIHNYVLDILLLYSEMFEKDKNFGRQLQMEPWAKVSEKYMEGYDPAIE
ncbi:hypothetical protein EVAR_86873_1 [Eumeta japonica]|uniref:Uncharacterized protein n=1 Tax=Eumeta variegata TaxID=151549 RepID=A0A4C1ZEQ4_EUMVA|nr:hypothetical protein EVAR_86873_1 [Eumeta japonica]